MSGWTEVGRSAPSGDTVWKCEAPLCGALVREGAWEDDHSGGPEDVRRREHDRQFHLLRMVPGHSEQSYDLTLDGKDVGRVFLKTQTYNLRRYLVSKKWVGDLCPFPGERHQTNGQTTQGDTMQEVLVALREAGAKAYGKGRNPKVWTYPKARR